MKNNEVLNNEVFHLQRQVVRGSGAGEVFATLGRLKDGGWELGFADEETAGYVEALMEQHEAKARAHVCEVRLQGEDVSCSQSERSQCRC